MTVDFNAELDDALVELRALAESRMSVTVEVQRPTGARVRDPETDSDVDALEVVFTSKARIASTDPIPTESEVGERTVVTTRERIDLPWDSPLVKPGDVAHVESIGPHDDPHLLGLDFEFIAAPLGTQKTAHRFPVRRYQS